MAMSSETGRLPRTLSVDDIAQLHADFAACDGDADGRVSFAEFESLLLAVGSQLSPGQRRTQFLRIDADGNGLIDVAEFRHWWQGQ
jgi:Ca2+-binding EF-hand superfamily protein